MQEGSQEERTPEAIDAAEPGHSWHSFFSEKDGKFFFFDPVQNISTWLAPNGKDQDNTVEKTNVTSDENTAENSLDVSLDVQSREIEVDDSTPSKGSTVGDLKQKFKEQATEIQENFKTVKQDAYPWTLLGIMIVLVVIKVFCSKHDLFPVFFNQGRVILNTNTNQMKPSDVLQRVEKSFLKTISDEGQEKVDLLPALTARSTTGDLQRSFQEGLDILNRVELARNQEPMERRKVSWKGIKEAATGVEDFVVL